MTRFIIDRGWSFLPSPCLLLGLIPQWFSRDFQSGESQGAHIARQVHPFEMHGSTAAKRDRRCTRDLVSVRRHWRTTRRYWYLRDEARAPFSRTMSVRLVRFIWRSRRKLSEGGRKAHCYFHGSSLILPAPSWDIPPTDVGLHQPEPRFQSFATPGPCKIPGWSGGGERKTFPRRPSLHRCRFASVRWACNAVDVNITVERGTLNT